VRRRGGSGVRAAARLAAGLAGLCAALPGFGCAREEPRTARTPRPGGACADCHDSIVDAWNAAPMAHALGRVAPGELVGLGSAADAAGFAYRFDVDDAGAYLVEHAPWGAESRAPIAFAIGAGRMDRSYAVVHGALAWFAPLERLSASDRGPAHAALAPGNAMHPGSRASVPITAECLGCHTDDPPPPTWPLNLSGEHLSGWEPRGLSCAACHAPVDAHAAWQADALSGAAPRGDDPMLRPAELTRFGQLSICAVCHLQGDVRVVLDGDLGPPEPGTDVLDSRACFVAREPTNDVGFVSHVERLMLSACFRASEMTCTTCHDPHRAIEAPGVRERTRAACVDCHRGMRSDHAGAPPAARDCVDCHMRRTPTFDVALVEIHDHWIRSDPGPPSARPAPGDLRSMEAPDGRWVRASWPGEPKPDHHDDPGLLMMALVKASLLEQATALVDVAPGPGARGIAGYHHVRAGLLEAAGRSENACQAYARALELDPDYAPAATNLALLEGELGDPAAGVARLDALLSSHPLHAGALRNRAVLRGRLGDVPGAIADLERALAVSPDATVAAALGRLYGRVGERARSAEYAALALRLDPRGE
jgi:predicted CXXCH cytochrome family protein